MRFPATGLIRGCLAFVLAVLLASQLALSGFAWRLFERQLLPEMSLKAAVIGESIQAKLLSIVALGVPFDRLVGVEEFFEGIRARNGELAFLALGGPHGTISHVAGLDRDVAQKLARSLSAGRPAARMVEAGGSAFVVTPFPLVQGGRLLGTLYVGVGKSYIDGRMSEIGLDILTVVVASLMVAFEMLLFIMSVSLQQPLRDIWATVGNVGRGDFRRISKVTSRELAGLADRVNQLVLGVDRRAAALMDTAEGLRRTEPGAVDDVLDRLRRCFQLAWDGRPQILRQSLIVQVRILTFLFMFAEQLSRPFLPLLVKGLLPGSVGRSADVLAGVPITAFMLVVALGMPIAGRWAERVGARRAFTAGAVAMTVGLLGGAVSVSIYDFTLWRMVTAAAYATMFMACQGFALEDTGETDRASGISTFVGAIMASEACSPAIGGILADRVGYRPVFILGAAVAVVAALLGRAILGRHRSRRARDQEAGRGVLAVTVGMRNLRFVILMLFAVIPARALLTGFLFFLVPLVMTHLGADKAEIGRVAMAYGLPGLMLAAGVSIVAARLNCHGVMVGLGGMIAGAGLLPILFHESQGMVLLAIAGLGVGQVMNLVSLVTLVTQVCRDEIEAHGTMAVIRLHQLTERLAGGLGVLAAGGLTMVAGPVNAMAWLGAGGFLCSVVFSAAFLILGVRPEDDLVEADGEAPA